MHWSLRTFLLVFTFLNPIVVCQQIRSTYPVRPFPVDLGTISQRAGTIFAGKVLRIEPVRLSSSNEIASVQITCEVERGVRGARDGQILAFREWAGLWAAGPRYRLGQRLMLFLYAPSSLGLTSPVGGRLGDFAVDRSGRIVLSPGQQEAVQNVPKAPIDVKRPVPLREFTRFVRRLRED